jgi:hypothetical protein
VVRPASSVITSADRWDHLLARLGFNRGGHRVGVGLYALGAPGPASPVFVTANYTLSFDALRGALAGIPCYILVLETYGVNVWCAAGKGTFGTDELVRRMELTGLAGVVSHRTLILPQLGATGVAAHEVRKRTGFTVEFGPVRAGDLPEYLKTHAATPEMRRVRFDLADRAVLIPVELAQMLLPMVVGAAAVFLVGGLHAALAGVVAVLAGVVLFPILLPWLPTRDFAGKGLVLGVAAALPFAIAALAAGGELHPLPRVCLALLPVFAMPPVTGYIALNFTGASTYTSKTGVRREMFRYIPVMAVAAGVGIALAIAYYLLRGVTPQ